MAYGLEQKTDQELIDLKNQYLVKIPELEANLLETTDADQIKRMSDKIIRLTDKQDAVNLEINTRDL